MPPECVGPYRISSCLGEGAFGAVYEAAHEDTGQRAAVKLLHASTSKEPEIQNRFVREIAILQRLDHENIVRHYDCGLHGDSIYCAMELIDSGTLRDVLQGGRRLPWREAAKVAHQVASGLAHAHANGCVHRDLKPANLYLSAQGEVKIGDLGLARDLEGSRLTAEGHTVGTWRYMAPEQIMAHDEIDGRLDLYALGCIMFRMLTGQAPFDGPDFAAIFDQHLQSTPPRADIVVSEAPKELADLIVWMMQKKPVDRPASAAVVAERLEEILDDDDAQLRETVGVELGDGDRSDDPTQSFSPLRAIPAISAAPVGKVKRHALFALLGAAAAAAAIALLLR